MKLKSLLKVAKDFIIKNAPQILAGVGIAGAFVSGVMAIKKTPEAVELINKKKEEEDVEKLSIPETIKVTWKLYLPALLIFLMSAGLIIGGQHVTGRRMAALATAYSLKSELKDYREAAKAVVGEKKEKEIVDEAAKNRVEKAPPVDIGEIVSTGRGQSLCYDTLSKRYFWSDIEKIRQKISHLNDRLRDEMYISVNDYWSELGLPLTPLGRQISWAIDKGKIDPDYSSVLVADGPYEGVPCLVISFFSEPEYNYNDRL